MLWPCFYTDVHEVSWEDVKTGEQKKMRSGATAWRSVGKSLEGIEVEVGKAGEVCKVGEVHLQSTSRAKGRSFH